MRRNIGKKMRKLAYLVNVYLEENDTTRRGLNSTQLQILNYLMCHDNVIQKDLETETQLKKSSITGSIDSLVDKDLVTRVKGEDDRRKNYIVLTKQAIDDRKLLEDKLAKLDDQIVEGIDKSDLETFVAVLDRMILNLKGKEE
ncbi:MAG: winged helix-turn-helix transcriptional regulator [Erysipelotrichaceae bacterium]|nr:winged helix-turn-helix transcriptional regulator [Erysipelotrichaceae bacterium]MBO7698401.1 winged helix-turn-helix transcriptional regulator [Erysipelotrichaceae bacterium]MBP5279151.1 winged helix-turn-helix transcriptional regulator [Erysipelotrichaceae bacterium]